jgi:hypothetical protein
MLEDPSVPVESEYLRRMVDIVMAVLSGGPKLMEEGANDVWAALPPGDWYRLATFITAAIAQGCIRTTDIGRKGAFDVEPCKDTFLHDTSLTRPATQRELLAAVSAQVQEELKDKGALLPQDSIDGLRATIWRAHEGQIRAWMECEVLSVYQRLSDICLSDICLSDILDLIEREATVEEITEAMKQDIDMEMRGKFKGLIATEKSRAFENALEEARTEGLRKAHQQGKAEAAQKGRAYHNMLLSRAEAEAKTEADKLFKSRLESERSKLKRKVEAEVTAEHNDIITERRMALEKSLMDMDFKARKDYVRSQAIQLGLLDELAMPIPSPPKCAKVGNAPRTAPIAASLASGRSASTEHAQHTPSGQVTPTSTPSSCPAAEEDDPTPCNSLARMDWAQSRPSDPLPVIDFSADTRSSRASIHGLGNEMVDDSKEVIAVSSFKDPDSGALPSTPASTHTLPIQNSPSNSPATAPLPKLEVTQLLELISAKLGPMEREIKHIANIVDGKPLSSQGSQRATASPHTTQRPGGQSSSPPAQSHITPPSSSRAARIDDDVDDDHFPELGVSASPTWTKIAGRGSSTPRAPAQGAQTPSQGRSLIGLSFAAVVTDVALDQREKAAGHTRLAQEVQKHNPSGRFKPGHSTALLGFTDVVVIREGSSEDAEVEEAFHPQSPVDIAQAAQWALNAIVRSPPIILRGHWSETVEKTGNFIFHFASDLSPRVVTSYQTSLCSHFPAAERACVVPTTGWTWVQFRGVDVAQVGGDAEVIHDGEALLCAIRANPCFNEATFCAKPHWQGNPANFRSRTATVIAAILDTDNAICQRASSEGVCLFGRHIKFVRAGDSPSLVQCSRCHEVGHYYTSPKCKWTTTRCYRCGGSHDACDHDFECKKQHKVVGTCDCVLKCILCKGSGHHAREKGCPVRGDFVPLRLPRAAPAEASPTIEDAQKGDAIPFTRPHARPAFKGRGRGKGKGRASCATRILDAQLIEDICRHNDEELRTYCFCCPAMGVDDFRLLYTNLPDSDEPAVLSVNGKSAQDIFGECITHKNKGRAFVEQAGTASFHTMKDLHEFLVKAAARATAHLHYSLPEPTEAEAWLVNMPTDEEAGWNASAMDKDIRREELADVPPAGPNPPPSPPSPPPQPTLAGTVKEADQAISGWKDARRQVMVHLPKNRVVCATNPDGSLVNLPAKREDRPAHEGIVLDRRADATEHVMIVNRQAQHIGWSGRANNQFTALAGTEAPPAITEEPSEVNPNV